MPFGDRYMISHRAQPNERGGEKPETLKKKPKAWAKRNTTRPRDREFTNSGGKDLMIGIPSPNRSG